MILGFTGGGKRPPTAAQENWLRHYLARDDVEVVHHGGCILADALCHRLALAAGKKVVVHPASDVSPDKVAGECFWPHPNLTILPAKPALARNRDNVDASTRVAALPDRPECLRSGTWATIRYARKNDKPRIICRRDGRISDDE